MERLALQLLAKFIEEGKVEFYEPEKGKKVIKGVKNILKACWLGSPNLGQLKKLYSDWDDVTFLYELYGTEKDKILLYELTSHLNGWKLELSKKSSTPKKEISLEQPVGTCVARFIEGGSINLPDPKNRKKVIKGIQKVLEAYWLDPPDSIQMKKLCKRWKNICILYRQYGTEEDEDLAYDLYKRLYEWGCQVISSEQELYEKENPNGE